MIRLLLTALMIAALAYGALWVSRNLTSTRTQVQCKIDYGLKGCGR